MAETNGAPEKAYTVPQVNPYGRVDEEITSVAEREEKRKKRMKYLVYIVLFIVFQTGIIMLFGLTIMKVRTPKFRVRSASVQNFQITNLDTNPSFDISMHAELGVKNANFGQYKYRNTTIEFFYGGLYKVGEVNVVRGRAKARSTRKFNVTVDLTSGNVPTDVLANELRTRGVIPLTSQSRLRGKVELMKIMKKNKSSNMNCTMEINTSSQQLQNLSCR